MSRNQFYNAQESEMRIVKLYFSLKFVTKSILLNFLLSSAAHAYVDGGAALLLLQGFFAAIGAILVFFKKPWQLISRIFSRTKKTDA